MLVLNTLVNCFVLNMFIEAFTFTQVNKVAEQKVVGSNPGWTTNHDPDSQIPPKLRCVLTIISYNSLLFRNNT